MLRGHDQLLSETVRLADVAVRTAYQLRLLKNGKPVRDRRALEEAVNFLKGAKEGSIFIIGQSSSLQRSLRPLNWATDAYLQLHKPSKPDYERVAHYFDEILANLQSAISSPGSVAVEKIEPIGEFFTKLGDILGSLADKKLMEVSEAPIRL